MPVSDDGFEFPVNAQRAQFPALSRNCGDKPAAFFDGPAGSQVPRRVIDAVSAYLERDCANRGGPFATSRATDTLFEDACATYADFLGAPDPACIAFGANMTALTFSLSRSLANTWKPGDEVVLTRLDHDANITPWTLAARDAGATVRLVDFDDSGCIGADALREAIGNRTRLVAFTAASNALGSATDVAELCRIAREAGALSFVDAVHYAPHRRIDVQAWGCDFVACSAYKFFGPHVGILWGKREHLEALEPYQVRPANSGLPDRWMQGTSNYEGIAGATEAVRYIESIGAGEIRRERLDTAFARIRAHEESLAAQLLTGLRTIDGARVWGSAAPDAMEGRVPTIALTLRDLDSSRIAATLGEHGIHTWAGHFYALEVVRALGLEGQGLLRVGILHYNTAGEIDRLLEDLRSIATAG